MRTHVVSCFISPLVVFLASVPAVRGGAGEVGFTEDFALSPDRAAVLKQLIPGTEEYYFYSCLSGQLTGKLDEVDRILKQWIDRHGRTIYIGSFSKVLSPTLPLGFVVVPEHLVGSFRRYLAQRGSMAVRRAQSGFVQNYALVMGGGIVLLAVVYLFFKP